MIMSPVTWLSVVANELSMAPGFVVELDRQLRAQAQTSAGVDLSDGGYALLPPDGGFVVQFRKVGDTVIGCIEGDLVDPAAHGHPVALAWRSPGAPGQRIRPDQEPTDLEFFWLDLPIAELSAGTRIDTSAAEKAVTARFPIDWDVHDWSSTRVRWVAQRAFTPGKLAALTITVRDAVRDWNEREPNKIHYLGEPEVSPDQVVVTFYLDLGPAGPDALVALINAVAASPTANAIARGAIGRRA